MSCSTPLEKSFKVKHPLYEPHQALVEANRCLTCYDAPCIQACPTSIDVPRFINAIADGDRMRSAKIILESNILGYSCARICPVEELCAGACVLHHRKEEPIAIGRLQHFACHHALTQSTPQQLLKPKAQATHHRVACIGAGPASIAVAALLALEGHHVELFEKHPFLGGLNAWGIAPYKLYFDDAQQEIAWLNDLGIVFHHNSEISTREQADHLLAHFDAIFFGLGLGDDKLDTALLPHPRIMGATDFIRRFKTDHEFSMHGIKTAHVIGGGNTAIDAAHELLLLGVPNVTLVYRREQQAMPAYVHEIDYARKSGLMILDHASIKAVQPSSDQTLMLTVKRTDHELTLPSDLLIYAIGQDKNMITASLFDQVSFTDHGTIVVDHDHRTHHEKIWAAGDCVNGGKEVVNAVAEAKRAATSIHHFLTNQKQD